MAKTRKKSIPEMLAEVERLQKEIELKEKENLLIELTSSREFKAVARQVAKLGLSGEDVAGLFGGTAKAPKPKRAIKPRPKVAPKYRHPEHPEQTWTGRGNQPKWFKEALAAGASPEDLLIKG